MDIKTADILALLNSKVEPKDGVAEPKSSKYKLASIGYKFLHSEQQEEPKSQVKLSSDISIDGFIHAFRQARPIQI